MSNNFQKGSEWRKWDLHVHTPFSIVNHYNGYSDDEKWENFISDLEKLPPEFKVIGINDYIFIDGYRKVIEYKNKGRLNNIELILPVIEFRINKFAGHKDFKKINFHLIFSNELAPDTIQQQFLNALNSKYKLMPGLNGITWSGVITKDSISDLGKKIKSTVPKDKLEDYGSDLEEGFNNLCLDEDEIIEILKNSTYLKGNYLTAIGKTEWEDLSWNDQSIATKKDLINKVDIVFISAENVDKFKKAKNKLTEQKVNNLLLDCSDAHYYSSSTQRERIGKCFTWIKADPTFEGLKQIIYEPEERVRIQENNPEYDFDKPTFSKIIINEPIDIFDGEKVKFNKIDELPLNKNLVTIIGGRGTGKSLLLNYIANIFNKEILAYKNKERRVTFNDSKNFIVEWQKNNNSNPEVINFNGENKGNLDFIFIEQGKLKNISDAKILANEIKKLLGIEKLQFNEKLDNEISQLLNEIDEIKKWFEYENENGEKVNSKELNESKRNESKKLLETITTKENKEQLERYTSNIQKIRSVDEIINQLEELEKKLSEFANDTNEVINNINSKIQEDIKDTKIPFVDFQTQLDTINNIKNELEKIKQTKTDDNNEIRKIFEEQGFKGDLTSLLSNAEKYQKDIQEAESKLEENKNKKELLDGKIEQRNKLGQKLKEEYERQKNEINDAWKNLLNKFENKQKVIIEKILKNRNILINGLIHFDKEKFDIKLKDYLDQRTYKNLSKDLNINNLDDYWNFIENELSKYIKGEGDNETLKTIKQSLEEVFLTLKERRDYLYVLPEIKYMDKTLDQLSVGQRGTLYLLLQLATNAFSSPLIFDQPEDDLDNAFITNELVVLFKDLKKYRQIIISTHNANLVVTADAEQVIVANNKDELLSYTSGSLENTTIIDNVCKILEGGKDAFEKRRNRYYSL